MIADAQFWDGALPPSDDFSLAQRELKGIAAVILIEFSFLALHAPAVVNLDGVALDGRDAIAALV